MTTDYKISGYKNIRYLSPLKIEEPPKKKYCIFKKYGLKYIDFKNPYFISKFLNNQGKIFPRRITGLSMKYQKKISKSIKLSRHIAIIPFITDEFKNENYFK
jgi:small subunit ribosomal protein S18